MFKSTAKLEYQGTDYEVDALVYVELEGKFETVDKIVAAPESEKDSAKEWLIYNTLIDNGFFVSRPPFPEPKLSEILDEPEPLAISQPLSLNRSPEPERRWTQSQILSARQKLIREEERLLLKQRREFNREKSQFIADNTRVPRQFYHPDGTPYTSHDYGCAGVTFLFVIVILLMVITVCRLH